MSGNHANTNVMRARQAALQMLYARELSGGEPDAIGAWFSEAHPLEPPVERQAQALVAMAASREERIEDLIRRHAIGWRLERISAIDRSLLKLGMAELLLAPRRSRHRAVQAIKWLAERYSQPEASGFLAGMLDAIGKELEAAPAAGEAAMG